MNSKEFPELLYSEPGIIQYAVQSALWQIPGMKGYNYKSGDAFFMHRDMAAFLTMNLPANFL